MTGLFYIPNPDCISRRAHSRREFIPIKSMGNSSPCNKQINILDTSPFFLHLLT